MSPYILLLIGFIFIFVEFYIPGAIMGILGGILLFASIVVFASEHESALAIFLYVLGIFIGLGAVIRFAMWKIRRAKPEYSIYSDSTQHGYKASRYDHKVIGKTGTVLSDLKPGGYILIEGKQYQAISESGYIVKGSHVIVLGGQEESLIVKHTHLKE